MISHDKFRLGRDTSGPYEKLLQDGNWARTFIYLPPPAPFVLPLRSSTMEVSCSMVACRSSMMLRMRTSGGGRSPASSRLLSRNQKRCISTRTRHSRPDDKRVPRGLGVSERSLNLFKSTYVSKAEWASYC